jgi:ring-1,2-phenylacetyl-CoA epoxidase subunit PaaD
VVVNDDTLLARAREIAAAVTDPELPVLTIADLGVLREVALRDGVVEVTITPTYSGCPAIPLIAAEIRAALARGGIAGAQVRTALAPAWTTEWISESGRRKLAAWGIAPPPGAGSSRQLFSEEQPACPRCGSPRTERISAFGATACRALHRCLACREPFDAFKCH